MSGYFKRLFLKYVVGYSNPQRYWDLRWKHTKDETFDWDEFYKKIKLLMKENNCESILEVGCGKAKVLRNLPNYIGLDFSLESLKRSKLKQFIYADITEQIPLPSKSVDAVFCRDVLLHIPPDKIEKATSEMSRVAKKCVILRENISPTEQTQKHCFSHNLQELFHKHFDKKIIFLDGKGNIV